MPHRAKKALQFPLALHEVQHQYLPHEIKQLESTVKPIYYLSENIANEPYGSEINIFALISGGCS